MDNNPRHVPLTAQEQAVVPLKLEACGLEVIDPVLGFVRCPGEYLHTHPTQPAHCKVFPNDGYPHLYCTHQSCGDEVKEANARLSARSPRQRAKVSEADRRRQEKAAKQEKKQKEILALRLKHALADIVRQHPWPYAEMQAKSPVKDMPPEEHWRMLLLALFDEEDIIWCGRDVQDSGPRHDWRFRTVDEWMKEGSCPGPFTCPHTFKLGVFSRSNDAILTACFLVVESDAITKDEIGAVFRWLETKIGLHLRAVVDTGSRSLHGWFDYLEPDRMDDLKIILPALGCDGKMFTLSQPCRLPGHPNPNTGNMQKLLYLAD